MKEKILTFEEIDRLAVKIAEKMKNGGCLGLIGDLGTGKTTFTKRICKEYNIHKNIKSPTFTYVIEYTSGDVTVYHFDAYRIINPEEIYEIGFEDYIGEENAAVIVEWADNIIDEMPEHTVYIEISYNDETSRKISMYKLKNGETTTKLAGISLHKDNKILGEIKIEVSRTHSTTILDQIESLFAWTGEKLDNVGNVLVSIGPGSFTGVRIAISVVKGMFYGRNVNFYQVNELDALAYQAFYSLDSNFLSQNSGSDENSKIEIYSMIDSGKEKIYCAAYEAEASEEKLRQVGDYEVIKLEKLLEKLDNKNKKIVIIGDAGINYKEKIAGTLKNRALFLADDRMKISTATFMQMFLNNILEKSDIFQLKPDYLEKSQAERDKK